jgi:Arc/MetJ-type ribon-helix-helix transcriptional regulator
MQPRAIRFSDKSRKAIELATNERGFASSSAFVRYAVEQELSGRQEDLTGAEERLAGSIEAVRRDLSRVMRVQQALFAYLDTLAKTFLTCVPEPPADAKAQAIARARERHHHLLKSAGQAMVGESKLAMHDLVENIEGDE